MTNANDPNPQRAFPPAVPEQEGPGSSFTGATWASLAFIVLLFGGVAFWAYQSGDMQEAANNRPGVERKMPPSTTGQGAPSSPSMPPAAPATKDGAN